MLFDLVALTAVKTVGALSSNLRADTPAVDSFFVGAGVFWPEEELPNIPEKLKTNSN